MSKFIIPLGLFLMLGCLSCTDGSQEIQEKAEIWQWSDNKLKEQEAIVLMQDLARAQQYEAALEQFEWLTTYNPGLHHSIYLDGLGIYEQMINNCDDTEDMLKLSVQQEKVKQLMKTYFPEHAIQKL
ncbi:hypothetical protein PZB74_14560 [Porifericola rhodea]|uniref:hypothetical protein n=1 Tax=Porifericola rhodea TaxID=930972 RepID=UPI00266529CC|nr:hypothetical protein [Porifericola rhodea]WKN30185.1 hypothetical protein PZB74_14560 [Porifericola rhodea]